MKKHYLLSGLLLCMHALAQTPPAPDALPQSGSITAGEAAIGHTGSTLSIQQSSDRAAIDWESFDVGSEARVEFLQPSSSSVTLNRVTGGNASQIFGRITANGQVYLSNPNGLYFAPGASVNVGGLVATTHSISVEDFMAGQVRFERAGATGSVINEGELIAALGGYIALLAPEVRNQGLILANLGTVALAAGEAFELQFGSNNTLANLRVTPSTIEALVDNRSAVLAPGGLIILSARAVDRIQGGVIRHTGVLEATGLAQRGGRIVLEGDTITLAAGSRIDASGQTGGGEVLVGGDWQGGGDMHQAHRVAMEAGASIDVSAIDSGDGGTAVLWSDVHAADGTTNAHGEILARGGAVGGDGGRIETSGHTIEIDGIQVSASAPLGKAGTWLIDPYSYNINAPAAATISNALSDGTSVTVTTTANNPEFGSSGNINDSGSIVVNSAITKSGGNDATLTLQAHRNVGINAPITSTGGGLNLVLWSDYGNQNVAGVTISSAIDTNGGHVWIGGSSTNGGSSTWNGLTVGNGPSVGSMSGNHNSMDLAANISTGGGDILIWTGQGVTGTNTGPGIGLDGTRVINAGSGNVTLLTNKIFNWQNSGALAINTTGHLTLAPSLNNAYDAAFNWTGTNTAGNFTLNNTLSANTLTINSVAGLGGLTIGQFSDMSGVSVANTSNVTVSSALSVAGPINIHGGQLSINANLSSTATGDIFLKSLSSANPAINISADILKTGGERSTLTLQAQGRVQLNAARKIEATGTALDVVIWSDYNNSNNDGGISILGDIMTNGGHLWAGGSNSVGGSYTWNGLTVGDGPSIGSLNFNLNAMDFRGTASTAGGDILLWAGSGHGGGLSGIASNSTGSLNAGSGNITLIADATSGTFPVSTTGMLTLVPDGGGFSSPFIWNGSGNPDFTLSGSLAGVRINDISSLGGLTIGRYSGMSNGGTPVVLGNTANVEVASVISIAGPLAIHGGIVNVQQSLSAGGDITLKASTTDVLLDASVTNTASTATALTIEAARHIRLGSDASIESTTAPMTTQLWADTDADGDGIVFLTSSGIGTRGGSLTFGREGQSASIGGENVLVGGDVFFQRESAQSLNTGGGDLNIYGETIVANTAGLTINTSNGAVTFHGLLNSGNAYTFVDKTGSAGSGTWDAARIEARNGTAGGSAVGDSYLVTITSRLENAIAGLAANYRGSWIGAYRPDSTSYNWVWADGPEGGQSFFTQVAGSGGSTAPGLYANFGPGEPNGGLSATRSSVESVAQFFGSAGLWNDLRHTVAYSETQVTQYAVLGFVRETNLAASPVTINAGTGAVTVQGGVGVSKALASLDITSSTTTVNGSGLVTTGAQSYSSELAANAGSGSLLLQGTSITAGGAVTATGSAISLNADLLSSTGNITLTGDSVDFTGPTTIDTSGTLTVQPLGTSFSSALTWPLANLTLSGDMSGLTLGKVGNTADITVASAQSIAGPISIYGGDITINASLHAGGHNTITLQASGNITDGPDGSVSALNLLLLGGNVTLDNPNNGVGYLAASGVGDLTFIDSDTLVINTIDGISGISATGTVNIGTLVGNLSLLNDVSTTNASNTALSLNAGISMDAGMAIGGSIFVFNDAMVSVGAGGRGVLFSGSVADSGGLTALIGSGSNRFRYNSDELASNYTLALGTGLYAIYREQPTVSLRIDNQSMIYGDTVPVWTYSLDNAVNGDLFAQSFSGEPDVTVNAASSTSNNYIAGEHALTGTTGSAVSQLGYAVSPAVTAGTLTVSQRNLTVTYTGDNKIYDGTTTATVHASDNRISGDLFSIAEAAAFDDANAGDAKVIGITGIGLAGVDAANYTFADTAGTTADITPRTLTLSGHRVYDGTTTLGANTITFGNLVGTETLGFSGASASDAHVATSDKYIVSIDLLDGANGGLAGNYRLPTLDANNAPVTITPATLTPTLSNSEVTRVYDGTTSAPADFIPSWTYSGLVAGDTAASLNSTSMAYNSKDVATASSLTVSGLDIESITGSNGSLSSDYVLDATSKSGAASITPRAVTVTGVIADDKIYDGSDAATLSNPGSVATGVGSETLSLGHGGATFSDANAGTAKVVTATGYAISDGANGGLASNYVLTSTTATTTANITPRTLLVNYSGVDKVYDGNTSAAVTITDDRIAGDALTIDVLAAFTDKNVGDGKVVTIDEVTFSGAASGNYVLSANGWTTASITRLESVTWIGGTNGNWFDPANWAGGAVPDLANVANVILPAGVDVSFDTAGAVAPAQTGAVQLESLGTAGSVTQNNGELMVGAGGIQLDGYTQNGGALVSNGDIVLSSFKQTGGSTATDGNFTVDGNFSQGASGSVSVGGDADISDTADGTTVGNLSTGGKLTVVSTDGDIVQVGGTAINVTGDASLRAPGNQVTLNPSGNSFAGQLTVVDASATSAMPPVPPPAQPELRLPTPGTAPTMAGVGVMEVSVALVIAPAEQTEGLLAVDVPGSMTSTGFSFALPEELMKDLPADTLVTASREDGGRLPAWLSYDERSQRFVATQIPAHTLPQSLVVTIGPRLVMVVISVAEDY